MANVVLQLLNVLDLVHANQVMFARVMANVVLHQLHSLVLLLVLIFDERYLSTDLYKNIKEDCDKMKETTVEEDLPLLKKRFNF
uniref:Uncharacterized protein n=1 Tax=Acrobeloides nanus TaxID=290746 RepID=A0A914E8H7_9BILA